MTKYLGFAALTVTAIALIGGPTQPVRASVSSSARISEVASTAAIAKCAITRIVERSPNSDFLATGACKTQGGRIVPSHWSWSYRSVDSAGVACGVKTVGATNRAEWWHGVLGGYRTSVTFRIQAKGYSGVAAKTHTFTTGNTIVSCADLASVTVPSASTICGWDDPNWPPAGVVGALPYTCGTPIPDNNGSPGCAWTSGAAMTAGVVSAGRFACAGGNCGWVFDRQSTNSTLFAASVATDQGYSCTSSKAGTTTVIIVIGTVRLVDPAGQTCQWWSFGKGHGTGTGLHSVQLSSFTIPSSWGGTFYVTFLLQAVSHAESGPVIHGRQELETASFPLSGTAGCNTFVP